ncbi:MAG TPA: cytochrome C oxidase subunit IV family protein [Planctomycetota bacterium]|jgi:cytochrome c oxidase subunit 4|nr:caa(3)-type oxidase subunit IV [Planctomycetota bacterium]MDP6128477.1 cytochrome C oxidase subunit IV family protein [Planctomycetota bacterium]MDP7246816.1 cytochrome C oxidase subunit IV family protein [Planctomycetota bacterium]MDP7559030.1 cytochrome C oxidase subunit IV family protein [Planctomycetota bacterium]HJM39953.1 cytochrome C oxidase subunit IV family protein [Planctomycetota bacterium]|tara:strand:- start:900 stop:1253 length:354 start_codon:yes stop_codon:yes gene_type:complete
MSDSHDHSSAGHVLSLKMLAGTFVALLLLTALTVATGKMDLHGFDLGVAMIIATIKATIVALIFMHLKWDRPFNGYIFLVAILFVGMFLAYVVVDTNTYQNDIKGWTKENISNSTAE